MPSYLAAEIQQFLIKNINVELSLTTEGGTHTLRGLQHFLNKKFADNQLQISYQSVLSTATAAEASCSGAGMEFLRLLCGQPKTGHTTRILVKSDMMKMLFDMGLSTHNASLVMQAYMLAGKHSKIAIKKAAGGIPVVELLNGYNFDIRSNHQFNFKKPRIACIDGYVETVAEIHHLLEHFASTKEPVIFFVRGLADDVLHTLRVNANRGTLNAHPVIVPFDLDHANALADIATIAGCDVVSHLKGDLISSIDPAALSQVDSVSMSSTGLIINNSKTSARVAEHRNRLIEDSLKRPEVSEILEKRIKSLTTSYVEISLVDGIDYLSNRSQVDEGVRRMADVLVGKDSHAVATAYYQSYVSSLENTIIM